jgi:cold shock CspA family protein
VHTHANEYAAERQQGSVLMYDVNQGFGFIKSDNDKSGNDIFFSRKNLTTKGQLPKARDRVEFCVKRTTDGRHEATEILVQVNKIKSQGLESYIMPQNSHACVRATFKGQDTRACDFFSRRQRNGSNFIALLARVIKSLVCHTLRGNAIVT